MQSQRQFANATRQAVRLLRHSLKTYGAMLAASSLLTLASINARAQQGPKCPTCPIQVPGRPMDNKDLNDMRQMNDRKRSFEAANAARKRLIDDEALRLVILARDLKLRTEAEPVSRTMEKEAAIIEFLANDLKQKMKLTVSPE